MGKTLETKKRILDLLKKKDMTVTELSRELGLSTATVSQHLGELGSMGAVEKLSNEHFKKLKYYRVANSVSSGENIGIIAKYFVTAIVAIAVVSGVYLYYSGHRMPSTPGLTTPMVGTGNATSPNSTAPVVPLGGFACPLISYRLNGTITGYSGFSLYVLNASFGQVGDYVMGNNSNGTLYISELVNNVLNQNNTLLTMNRTHYYTLTQLNSSTGQNAAGINVTISPGTYDAVNNTIINMTVVFKTSDTGSGTYWLRVDGPCSGGIVPVLVTVGNGPYNGTITEESGTYA